MEDVVARRAHRGAGASRRATGAWLHAAEVKAALPRGLVVKHFGLEVRGRAGGWWRGRTCPACQKRWRDLAGSGFCIGEHGWKCQTCGEKGDLLNLFAWLAGIDIDREFQRVLELAAGAAGLTPCTDPAERACRKAELAHAETVRRRDEAVRQHRRRIDARNRAGRLWPRLMADHERGRAYLTSRGLDVDTLVARGLVKFCQRGWLRSDAAGHPAIALHDWDGVVLNLVRRRTEDGGPKAPGLTGAPTDGTLVGHLDQISPGMDVVVPEGVVDSLTAALAWPHAVILGAPGAAQMPAVVTAAAPRVRIAGGRILIVPDNDTPGKRAAVEAGRRAFDAGLVWRRDVVLVRFGDHRDLNAAWTAGWRP